MEIKQFNYIYSTENFVELSACCEECFPLIWNREGIYKLYSTSMILNVIDLAKLSSSPNIKLLWVSGLRISSDVARLLIGEDAT